MGAAAGNDLQAVQADIEGDTATVRRFLAAQGYAPGEVDLGRLEVTDQYAREYQQQNVAARYRVAQTVIVRTPEEALSAIGAAPAGGRE